MNRVTEIMYKVICKDFDRLKDVPDGWQTDMAVEWEKACLELMGDKLYIESREKRL